MVLERELAYFEQIKEELLVHNKGQFAVIKDESLLGTFTTDREAFAAGVAAYGTEPFMVRPVLSDSATIQFPALTVGMINVRT